MSTSRFLSYQEFLLFFQRNGYAVWSSLVRHSVQLPPESVYNNWLEEARINEERENNAREIIFNDLSDSSESDDKRELVALYHTVTFLNDAQIKSVGSAPFLVLPAPGPKKRLKFLEAELRLFLSVDPAGHYTNIDLNDASIWMQIGEEGPAISNTLLTWSGGTPAQAGVNKFLGEQTFIGMTPTGKRLTGFQSFYPVYNADPPDPAMTIASPAVRCETDLQSLNFSNKAIYLAAWNNELGDYQGGHPDNYLQIDTWYYINYER